MTTYSLTSRTGICLSGEVFELQLDAQCEAESLANERGGAVFVNGSDGSRETVEPSALALAELRMENAARVYG